jgi:hypothetical protein
MSDVNLPVFGNSLLPTPYMSTTGVQTFHVKGPQPLMWAGWRAARGKITINGGTTRLNYRVIHRAYT